MADDWNKIPDLPPPGEGWGAQDEPQPLHHVPENDWGTAPQPNQPSWGPPGTPPGTQPPMGPPPGQPPMGPPTGPPMNGPGQAWQPPHQGPPGQPPVGGPMMPHANHGMTPSEKELESEDYIPILLSLPFPGLGHIMLGQRKKGIALLAISLPLLFFTCGTAYLVMLAVAYDAYLVTLVKRHRPVGEWEFLPQP